jgi:aminomethyltransferase
MTVTPSKLRQSPLATWHRSHGGRLAPYAGWEMPSEYGGAAAEHMAVRQAAGLFDLSHLGELEIAGKDALAAVQQLSSADAARLEIGQAQASVLVSDTGAALDDLRVLRLGRNHFLLLVSAGSLASDAAWVVGQAASFNDAAVVDTSSRYALLALHGPAASEILQGVTAIDIESLEADWFTYGEVVGVRATILRSEYSGEVGFDILVPPQGAPKAWEGLLREGEDLGLVPAGLAALDTLRLEAGVPAWGVDFDARTNLVEAGLTARIGWEKPTFVGKDALTVCRDARPTCRLVGFQMEGDDVAASGYDLVIDGRVTGRVTSGSRIPSRDKAVGLAYVPADRAEPGTEIEVDVAGRLAPARVVSLPFYTRSKG